jgi:hypothetical protein
MTLAVTGFAYFLDIDGTLVDLADAPTAVKRHPALPGLVEALYERWPLTEERICCEGWSRSP